MIEDGGEFGHTEAHLHYVRQVLARIKCPERRLIAELKGDYVCIRVEFESDGQTWKGRPWPVSRYATDGEMCQTALKAVLTSLEHECREHFLVDGVAVFGPHIDLEALKTIALKESHREDQ